MVCKQCEETRKKAKKILSRNLFFNSGLIVIFSIFVIFILNRLTPTEENAGGFYNPINKQITIFASNKTYWQVVDICMHEIGHHIYHEKLTQEQKNNWIKLFNNYTNESFVSNYAKKNSKEDFAESFKNTIYCYFDNYTLDKTSNKKAHFMTKLYNSGWGEWS